MSVCMSAMHLWATDRSGLLRELWGCYVEVRSDLDLSFIEVSFLSLRKKYISIVYFNANTISFTSLNLYILFPTGEPSIYIYYNPITFYGAHKSQIPTRYQTVERFQ